MVQLLSCVLEPPNLKVGTRTPAPWVTKPEFCLVWGGGGKIGRKPESNSK